MRASIRVGRSDGSGPSRLTPGPRAEASRFAERRREMTRLPETTAQSHLDHWTICLFEQRLRLFDPKPTQIPVPRDAHGVAERSHELRGALPSQQAETGKGRPPLQSEVLRSGACRCQQGAARQPVGEDTPRTSSSDPWIAKRHTLTREQRTRTAAGTLPASARLPDRCGRSWLAVLTCPCSPNRGCAPGRRRSRAPA